MADSQRIDDLRRRVQKDPASIAFAQLAEECRRAGRFDEAVDVCRAGLDLHPGYLSARVTLGRALVELNALDDAQTELELVLRSAPENLAAIRGLAEIHHRRGSLVEALRQYRAALALAKNDPDLQRTVADLETMVEPPPPPPVEDGLTFAEAEIEFLKNLPPPPPKPRAPAPPPPAEAAVPAAASPAEFNLATISPAIPQEPAVEVDLPALELVKTPEPEVAMDLTASPRPIVESSADFGMAGIASEPAQEPAVDFDLVAPPSRPPEPSIEIDLDARIVEPGPIATEPEYRVQSIAAREARLPVQSAQELAERERATRTAMETIVVLEQWLDAIHAVRTQRSA